MDDVDEGFLDVFAIDGIAKHHQVLQAYGKQWLAQNNVQYEKKPQEEEKQKRKIDDYQLGKDLRDGSRSI